jgi:uncharacterized protein YndB with AHSA1/START domain
MPSAVSMRRLAALLLAASPAAFACAEVVDVGDNGFAVQQSVTVAGDPAKAWAAAVAVGKWWDPEHTYSGDAANLSLDARPGGCWCEKLPDKGGVEHMRVVFASPGKLLRLDGGLGPLQAMAVAGTMTWTFTPARNGGTTVALTYLVGGYNRGGFKEISGGVDAVLHSQIERYKRYADTGKP